MNRNQIEDWKDVALEEAKRQGYIKDKGSTIGITIKKVMLIALFIIFFLGFKYFWSNFSVLADELSKIEITEEMEIQEIVENENFDVIVNNSLQILIGMMCIVGVLA